MSKASPDLLIVSIVLLSATNFVWAQDFDLRTLFTTEQERRVINANRYKEESGPSARVIAPIKEEQAEPVIELLKEEVKVQYKISGVTTDLLGSQTAWINGKSYLSGETMDDKSRVTIQGTRVIITTPDGKRHQAQSGEVLDVTYLRNIEN